MQSLPVPERRSLACLTWSALNSSPVGINNAVFPTCSDRQESQASNFPASMLIPLVSICSSSNPCSATHECTTPPTMSTHKQVDTAALAIGKSSQPARIRIYVRFAWPLWTNRSTQRTVSSSPRQMPTSPLSRRESSSQLGFGLGPPIYCALSTASAACSCVPRVLLLRQPSASCSPNRQMLRGATSTSTAMACLRA